jgi:hypothetical protein
MYTIPLGIKLLQVLYWTPSNRNFNSLLTSSTYVYSEPSLKIWTPHHWTVERTQRNPHDHRIQHYWMDNFFTSFFGRSCWDVQILKISLFREACNFKYQTYRLYENIVVSLFALCRTVGQWQIVVSSIVSQRHAAPRTQPVSIANFMIRVTMVCIDTGDLYSNVTAWGLKH